MAVMKISMSEDDYNDFFEVYGEEGFYNLADDYESFVKVYVEEELKHTMEPFMVSEDSEVGGAKVLLN